ncbi:peptidase M15 [Kriegella sp. EG-1]|nr:peptidase M15 [Flavobacteriaceae bacterium EG-1]
MKKLIFVSVILMLFSSCKDTSKQKVKNSSDIKTVEKQEEKPKKITEKEKVFRTFENLADTTFVRLADFSDGFAFDMRYATKNNFLKEKVYDCAECYTRVKTVKALLAANEEFKKSGVKIKFYDCYRPNSVQYKMWAIIPNPQYVANPKKGSIHNKGGAVDITLVSLDGEELDMGTDFDYFGKRAYLDNFDLPKEILANRKLLKETMEKHGFWSTRTEWWHYNLQGSHKDKIANFKWNCN